MINIQRWMFALVGGAAWACGGDPIAAGGGAASSDAAASNNDGDVALGPALDAGGRPSAEDSGTPTDAGIDGGDAGPSSSYAISKQYVGAYAAMVTNRYVLTAGSIGTMNVLQTIYATAALTDDPGNHVVTVTESGCHMDLTGTGTGVLANSTFQVPDTILTTTKLTPAIFSASTSGGQVTWSTQEIQGPVGWRWTAPSDAIPTSSSDSRVFDQDSDGHPGVTITFKGGVISAEIYVAEAQRNGFAGTANAAGELRGTNADTSQQNVIGSNNALLNTTPITRTIDANTANNLVRIVKVPTALTCAQLMGQTGTLFP